MVIILFAEQLPKKKCWLCLAPGRGCPNHPQPIHNSSQDQQSGLGSAADPTAGSKIAGRVDTDRATRDWGPPTNCRNGCFDRKHSVDGFPTDITAESQVAPWPAAPITGHLSWALTNPWAVGPRAYISCRVMAGVMGQSTSPCCSFWIHRAAGTARRRSLNLAKLSDGVTVCQSHIRASSLTSPAPINQHKHERKETRNWLWRPLLFFYLPCGY